MPSLPEMKVAAVMLFSGPSLSYEFFSVEWPWEGKQRDNSILSKQTGHCVNMGERAGSFSVQMQGISTKYLNI